MEVNKPRESVIYVTGFGPFGKHLQNASQVVVEKLPLTDIESELNVKLYIDILPVSYEYVSKKLLVKWKELQPKLVIHIGVSDFASSITLETQAFNDKYCQLDIYGSLPCLRECIQGNPLSLETKLNLNRAKEEIANLDSSGLSFTLSTDPGRYLCGFVYYTSLSIDSSRTVFIHIPPLECISSTPAEAATSIAKSICSLIKVLYKQVCEEEETHENIEKLIDCTLSMEVVACKNDSQSV